MLRSICYHFVLHQSVANQITLTFSPSPRTYNTALLVFKVGGWTWSFQKDSLVRCKRSGTLDDNKQPNTFHTCSTCLRRRLRTVFNHQHILIYFDAGSSPCQGSMPKVLPIRWQVCTTVKARCSKPSNISKVQQWQLFQSEHRATMAKSCYLSVLLQKVDPAHQNVLLARCAEDLRWLSAALWQRETSRQSIRCDEITAVTLP